jgi:hypothetical protein
MSTLAVNAINAASGGTITITGAALTTPALGTPASGTLTNCTGLPANTGLSGTTLASNVVNASINEVTPTGGTLAVTGSVSPTENIVAASGKGIDFSATPGTGTSELFADYEEGTITATATPDTGTITLSTNTLRYTKTGRVVHVSGVLVVGSVSAPTGNVFFTLPFASGFSCGGGIAVDGTNAFTGDIGYYINETQSVFYVYYRDVTGAYATSASIFKAGTVIRIDINYTS